MRNILIDLIDTQGEYKGSGVYIRKVFVSLVKYVDQHPKFSNVHFVCTYDSRRPILYSDLSVEKLSSSPRNTVVDVSNKTFADICNQFSVDTVFLGFGQQIYYYDFSGVSCRVICVLHDIFNLEFEDTKLDVLLKPKDTFATKCHRLVYWMYSCLRKSLWGQKKMKNPYMAHVELFCTNNNYEIVTVSQFSYYSISSQLPFPKDKITVLWSPEKEMPELKPISNPQLKQIVEEKIRYLLLVSADRYLKNSDKAIKAFLRYLDNNQVSDLYMITIGYKKSCGKNHLVLPFLSDVDIEHAYKNCYALLYPSVFEGFGYPPLEVMKYGKPVLASNVCSMPEILETAPIWFSPFYTTDIYKAIDTLMHSDYNQLCKKSHEQYLKAKRRQEKDLNLLMDMILS